MTIDGYESAVQPSGVFAAFFERDEDTAYFYLMDLRKEQGRQIVNAFNVRAAIAVILPDAIKIEWAWPDDLVGLFVGQSLCAVFDVSNGVAARFATEGDMRRFSERLH